MKIIGNREVITHTTDRDWFKTLLDSYSKIAAKEIDYCAGAGMVPAPDGKEGRIFVLMPSEDGLIELLNRCPPVKSFFDTSAGETIQ